MAEQIGWRGLVNQLKHEAPLWASLLPQLPRLAHQALSNPAHVQVARELSALRDEQARQRQRQTWLIALIAAQLALSVFFLMS
jgi:ubiquinone biosynthesis protein